MIWPAPSIGATGYGVNGRNQYANGAGTNFTYDSRGNLTSTGAATFGYDAFNRLTSAGTASLAYDPAGRLYQTQQGSSVTRFLYDGLDAIAEYNASGTLLRRYVHGPGFDEPIVQYEGSGTSDRRWPLTDQLGSVVAAANATGAIIGAPNTYDEYGQPGSSNAGRFQYTGQMWLSEAGLYHYKARAYAPSLGRFLQTDPILYAGGMNLYAYVGSDPVNLSDPLGLDPPIVVRGTQVLGGADGVVNCEDPRRMPCDPGDRVGEPSIFPGGTGEPIEFDPIIVEAIRCARNATCYDADQAQLLLIGTQAYHCPAHPQLQAFLQDMQQAARALNTTARLTGQNREIGGALGFASGGGLVSSRVATGIGSVNLPAARNAFIGQYGFAPSYDWHTHVLPGVNGATFGFSALAGGGGDVFTTANTPESFRGSFLVMPNQVRYLSRGAAREAYMSGQGSQAGVRCW